MNYARGDFRLSAAIAGSALGAGYDDTDADGVTRGSDGIWDRGAFEFNESAGPLYPSRASSTPTRSLRGIR